MEAAIILLMITVFLFLLRIAFRGKGSKKKDLVKLQRSHKGFRSLIETNEAASPVVLKLQKLLLQLH
jgi:hypothetical protein